MSDRKSETADYGIEICRQCDAIKPESEWMVGPQVERRCPDCGGPMFGMLGTEIIDA